MKTLNYKVLALAVLLLLGFIHPAQADETAKAANTLLVTQLTDVLTTQVGLNSGRLYEADPLARPFTKSVVGNIGSALVVNLIARTLFKRAPHVLWGAAYVEGGITINNMIVDIHGHGIFTEHYSPTPISPPCASSDMALCP